VDADEVLKTLALRTAGGYALLVIPASRRLDLHLAREAVGDSRARLATEEELADAFAGYQLGALPPLAGLVDAEVVVDPEVLGHDVVAFAAGTQTESVRLRPGELFRGRAGHHRAAGQAPRARQRRPGWSAPGGAAGHGRPRATSVVTWFRHASTSPIPAGCPYRRASQSVSGNRALRSWPVGSGEFAVTPWGWLVRRAAGVLGCRGWRAVWATRLSRTNSPGPNGQPLGRR
jgi:prolyl-tRNA editing enzyme YbaK/EbsC (Cys-tRNA(Pro) deacylase)